MGVSSVALAFPAEEIRGACPPIMLIARGRFRFDPTADIGEQALPLPLERIPFEWTISGIGEIVGAFLRREAFEDVAEGVPEGGDSPGGDLAEQRLELGEGLLDRVEIGTVGRQIDQVRAARLDRLAHAGDLVAAEIIHDDKVAWSKGRREHLFDIGSEDVAVHGAVHYQRGCKGQKPTNSNNASNGGVREPCV